MKTFFLAAFLLAANLLFSQKTVLRGTVADSNAAPLPAATVALLHEKDSVMAAFAMTDDAGKFALRRVAPGQYLLQITYLGFRAHWQKVAVETGKTEQDLGQIAMNSDAAVLSSVEVLDEHSPMRVRMDTVEYNAAAFKVRPNDVVEDLLRKLPGVEVQRDGTVKAHGETVQNVLVDGKEFFGKDTRIATKNLPADAVDRVQIFDKKSEMAEFTGIEDGQDEKTINLKLKPGKKHGYFGKMDAGAGTDGRFAGKMNLNRFSPRTRVSAIGMANNVNEQGFSFDEYLEFMGGIGAFMSGGGRVEISGDDVGGLPLGDDGTVQGIQHSGAVGLNLNHDFSRNAELTSSYFFNRFQNDLDLNRRRDNFLDEGIFSNFENQTTRSRNLSHRLNFALKTKLDSARQRLTLRGDATWSDGFLKNLGEAETFGTDQFLENRNLRDFVADSRNYQIRSSLVWKRKFRQAGRAIVASASGRFADRERGGQIFSENQFFRLATPADSLRQRQAFDEAGLDYGLNLAWTEPLGRRQYLKFDLAQQNFGNDAAKDFFDIADDGSETRNSLLSNDFRRDFTYQRAGFSYFLNRRKSNLTAVLNFQNSRLDGQVGASDQPISVKFSRLLPALFFEKEGKQGRRWGVDYSTLVREPRLDQLQPVPDNSDPLNILVGNPRLRPEYQHDLRARYFLYDMFSFTSLFANLGGSWVEDKITEAASVDSLFRRTISPVNVSREWRLRGSVDFSTPIRPLKIASKIRLSGSHTQSILFVNDVKNDVGRRRMAVDFSLENRKKSKVDVLAGVRLAHNLTDWSVSEEQNRRFNESGFYSELAITPDDNWLFDSKFDYSIYPAAAFGERREVALWQASVTRYFLKNKRGRVRLSAANLLDQNLGIRRTSEFNFVQQEQFNALRRYFLVSFGYSLQGFEKKDGGIEIKMGN